MAVGVSHPPLPRDQRLWPAVEDRDPKSGPVYQRASYSFHGDSLTCTVGGFPRLPRDQDYGPRLKTETPLSDFLSNSNSTTFRRHGFQVHYISSLFRYGQAIPPGMAHAVWRIRNNQGSMDGVGRPWGACNHFGHGAAQHGDRCFVFCKRCNVLNGFSVFFQHGQACSQEQAHAIIGPLVVTYGQACCPSRPMPSPLYSCIVCAAAAWGVGPKNPARKI